MKEIYKGEEMKDLLLEGINDLANTVTITMGPNGKTVGVTNFNGEGYVTKDGVTVSNNILFKNYIKDYGAKLVKEVASKTVDEAGDGTTTSICLAQSIINKGFQLLGKGISYNEIKKSLDLLEIKVLDQLKKSSKRLLKSDIINVATISANNDENIGKIISKAYFHSNIVKVEESDNEHDELITVDGIQLDTGYFHKAFINNEKKRAISYDKTKLIIIDGKLLNINQVKDYVTGVQEYPIVIMADHVSETVLSTFKQNYNEGRIQVGFIKSPAFAGHRRNIIDDLKRYFKMDTTKEASYSIVDSIYSDNKKSIISCKDIDKSGLSYLKEAHKVESDKSVKKLLQERIDLLNGKLSIIKVGGNSELEMRERKDRIDDAVLAVKSAMEEGIIEGGGVAFAKIYSYYNIPLNIKFEKCLMSPYNKIFGEKVDPMSKDMYKEKIIDPHKVARCAFQNAISVAKTILNMEAIVVNDRAWN